VCEVTAEDLNPGAILLRILHNKKDCKYPSYFALSILDPIGDGGAELKGLDKKVTVSIFKKALAIAKNRGFTYVRIYRIRNDQKIKHIYPLNQAV
jgi:hypothetical protein